MQNFESEPRSNLKAQQANALPFCVRRYWWLAVLVIISMIFIGAIAFQHFKSANETRADKKTTPLEKTTELANTAENAHLAEKAPAGSQPTKPLLTQGTKSKEPEAESKQQLSGTKSGQVAEMSAVLKSAYKALAPNLNKIVTDSYRNKYTIKNFYLRDFKEYTWVKKPRTVLLQR